jgi:putative transposase
MRGRKAAQIKGIEQYDFDKLANTKSNPRERRRFLAFAHLCEGKTFTEVAIFVRVKLRSLMRWVKKFKTEGLEGLKDKAGRGAKPLMPLEHRAAFRQAVLELQEKRTGGRIRGRDVLELMQTKYGIDPTLKTVYNTLKKSDLVWITGRSIHPKADLEDQEAFKKTSEKK